MSDNISKNDDGKIVVKQFKNNKTVEATLDLEDEVLTGIYSAIRDLMANLIISKGKWESKANRSVMRLVKELIEFAEGYKYIAGKDKKELAMLIINEIFTKELDESELDENIKQLIKSGIGYVIEPALEIAVFAAKGNIKINKKKLKKLCFFCDVE